uniref:Uncharacterized protein n=1 Tax=Arcella intermedia TaxID=1963864 RepID=A0A6B2L0K9_9EUKA
MLNVAKSLASHDVAIRNKGVQMVEDWLRTTTPSPVEMQKTWGALFFCMWHSDKPLVQHELAQRLAKSQYLLIETPLRFQWIKAFWDVHTSKWTGIDKHRLDKYYALLRYFVHESLRILYKMDWDKESLDLHIKVLSELPLSSSAPRGIIFHLSDLYVEELQKVLQETPIHTLQSDIFLALLEPFFNLMKTGDKFILKRVSESVFTGLLDRWTELLDPSDEANKTSDFEEREEYILNLMTQLSQKLLTLSTSMDIASPNRTAFYNARVGFEEILGELGKDLKKRKIDQTEADLPELKRTKIDQTQPLPLSAGKEKGLSSETSSGDEEDDEAEEEVDEPNELAEGDEVDVGGESEDESDSGEEEEQSEEEPELVAIPAPQPPKLAPVTAPAPAAPKQAPKSEPLPAKKVEVTGKPPAKTSPATTPKATAPIKTKNSPTQTAPKPTPAGTAVTKKLPPAASANPKPAAAKPPATAPQRTLPKEQPAKDTPANAPVPALAAKGRPSATLQEQPKVIRKSPVAAKKEEKKKVIFNLEKNKSVDLNEFQFDAKNRPHRPHAQPKTGILKTTVPTHNPIKRNKFNPKAKQVK